jgi:hypothetical protein
MKRRSKRDQVIRSPRPNGPDLAGIEYHGVAGSSVDCQLAVVRLLQGGVPLVCARIVTAGNTHCLILTLEVGDLIAVKSGFGSGYGGTGSTCFSIALQLLNAHHVEIDEWVADQTLIARLDESALTTDDIESISTGKAVRPSRWPEYILERHREQGTDGTLWREFPPLIPFSIIDSRIMDLAINFWGDPDSNLMRGYRRLEDIVRERTRLMESTTKLFSRAFTGTDAGLTWVVQDESEKNGRYNLFAGAYMAYRNPRAHRELPKSELLSEFLLLNHLFKLEREAVQVDSVEARPLMDWRYLGSGKHARILDASGTR